jgi:hypothetical protein
MLAALSSVGAVVKYSRKWWVVVVVFLPYQERRVE